MKIKILLVSFFFLFLVSPVFAWDRFGGDEWRTRALDETPPFWEIFGKDKGRITPLDTILIFSFWRDLFTNLKEARLEIEGLKNITISLAGTSSWANFTLSSLPAGLFFYRIYTSDIYGNENSTYLDSFEVTKLESEIKLFLNGYRGGKTFDYGKDVEIMAVVDIPEAVVEIWTNFTGRLEQLAKGPSPLTKMINTREIGIGSYSIIANWSGNEQYKGDEEGWIMEVKDISAPVWREVKVEPPSGSIWSLGKRYVFSVSWEDNMAVDSVTIEHNFEGGLKTSVMNSGDGFWFFEYFNLSIGEYRWRSLANDTFGNLNSTPWFEYRVSKKLAPISLFLDGEMANRVYDYGEIANLTATLPLKEVEIWTNFTGRLEQLAKGPSPLTKMINTKEIGIGSFKVKAYYPGDEEYAASVEEWVLEIKDLSPPRWEKVQVEPNTGKRWFLRSYKFTLNWLDNLAVDKVLIEHNFTGKLTSFQMEAKDSLYFYTYPNLAPGSYRWRSLANDTFGNLNSTPWFEYRVEPPISLTEAVILITVLSWGVAIFILIKFRREIFGK